MVDGVSALSTKHRVEREGRKEGRRRREIERVRWSDKQTRRQTRTSGSKGMNE
jgi:hypothetical protein